MFDFFNVLRLKSFFIDDTIELTLGFLLLVLEQPVKTEAIKAKVTDNEAILLNLFILIIPTPSRFVIYILEEEDKIHI